MKYTALNDGDLWGRIAEGDRDSFNEVYKRYWHKLYRTALDKIKCSDEAEDMVQDLFVSLWMKRESLVIHISLSSYLFAAIKYKIINHIEANITRRNYLDSLNKAVIDYDNATSDYILCKDTERWMDLAIRKLPPKVKRVYELSRKENLSINEIATQLDISDQTVKNQISKALKTLRVHLDNISTSVVLFFSFLS